MTPDAQFGMSIRVILGAAESFAWDRAMGILKRLETLGGRPAAPSTAPRKEVYDARFWTGLYDVVDAGERAALVGTPDQVAGVLRKYAGLGIGTFFIQGFHPFSDAEDQGRDLLPLLRGE
jgi:alkanesulfonate monooxygenase